MFHSCGAIRPLIGDLIEIDVDILDPVQPLAAGMDIAGLKKEFSGKICFHGSICTQQTLPKGAPDEVRREVLNRLELFKNQGGYILAPAHIVQPDAPLENIIALYQTARDFSQGAWRDTGRALDFLLEGPGFFTAEAPDGSIQYTRSGVFYLSVEPDGDFLVGARGRYLLFHPADWR